MKNKYAMCVVALNLLFLCGVALAENSERKLYNEIRSIYDDFYGLELPSSKRDIDYIKEKSRGIEDSFVNMRSKKMFDHSDGCRLSHLFYAFSYQYHLVDNKIECSDNICIFDDVDERIYWKALEDYREKLLACDEVYGYE